MGRVRRYKKVKSCDPFSKNFNRREIDTIHDEPPNIFDDKIERLEKKARRLENNQMFQTRKFHKLTDSSSVVSSSATSNFKEEIKKIEGKRDDETMKAFKKRLRQQTRETLRDEIKGLTSTAQKRKLRLKERKQQRKKGVVKNNDKTGSENTPRHNDDITLERQFGASENGTLRASDLDNAKMDFDIKDDIKFNERVEAPPDLRFTFKMAGAKKIGLGAGDCHYFFFFTSAQKHYIFLIYIYIYLSKLFLYSYLIV
jgi:hypothetical protein